MTTPHKHRDLIIAWANGATIQCKSRGEWDTMDAPGSDGSQPGWFYNFEYRLKPEPTIWYMAVVNYGGNATYIEPPHTSRGFATANVDPSHILKRILRIETDPDTLELVSAEMEKP